MLSEGITVDELYAVGAFLPASELQAAGDKSGVVPVPFVEHALESCHELLKKIKDSSSSTALPSAQEWWSKVQEAIVSPATSRLFEEQLNDFIQTGRSNGRALLYSRMCISKNKSFVLHAHPNIEIIYVVQGTLYERRLRQEFASTNDHNFGETYHIDLSTCSPEAFETRVFSQGQVLLNEIGSVHRSYTMSDDDKDVELFLLWGVAGHCNVPEKFTPISERIASQTSSASENNCSAWIANALFDAGVRVVYGGHGGALAPLVNAVVNRPGLTWVCCRNEANASLMAAAHAKLTGQLACVIATSGPGATNLTTGLMEAALDQVPVLCLTGLKPREGMHFSEFQDVDQSRLFAAGGIEFSYDAASPEALVPLLRDAVAMATTRSTCAHLAIPVDIQAAPCPIPVDRPFCAAHASDRISVSSSWAWSGGVKDQNDIIDNLVQILSSKTKKVLIAIGLWAVDAGDDILKLAEHLRAPIVTRMHAKGAIDELHPLVLGVEGIHGKPGLETSALLLETADIVLNFGVTDCTLLVCNTAGLQTREMIEFQKNAFFVSTRFRAVQTCLGADMGEMARALLQRFQQSGGRQFSTKNALKASLVGRSLSSYDGLAGREFSLESKDLYLIKAQVGATDVEGDGLSNARLERAAKIWAAVHSGAWIGRTHNLEKLEESVLIKGKGKDNRFAHPAHALMEVSRHLTKETVVCIDTGDVTLWGGLCLKLKGGTRTLTSERLGTMGYGLCAGISSILARNAPATSLVLAGDGGFQMTLQELATFRQHKRPGDRLIVIVFDNGLLGRVIFGFDGAKGCEIEGPDFVALAKAYGGHGYFLNDPVKIGEHVRDAQEGLTILHVPIDPALKADMATFQDGAVKIMKSG